MLHCKHLMLAGRLEVGKTLVFQNERVGRKQIRALLALLVDLEDFAPGRAVARIGQGDEALFVKRYRRSMKPWWKRILRRPYQSPLRNEAMLLARLQTLGFSAPEPLLYTESRHPRFHESLLLTRFLPGVPLATLTGEALQRGAHQALSLLAQLHAHGIAHGDCNPYNFLVAEQAYLLDFERADDFSREAAVDDFKKIMLRLRDLGLSDEVLEALAARYASAVDSPVLDARAILAELQGLSVVRKPTRWRPPQQLQGSL
ncbi:lipopolysaccharide kinase InaA family protein [Pseudomonas sp. URMO17WK12:I2]|uniref:lipopolysaccharide kinase InaA family protein n=1 Tax=Pseudomonas sp. URMO17WK12:I2 TaxID=1261623 RepID=UPI000DADE8FA|nr:lipopolysaccharide kinase InaA family protein [Pseudomonas sp. URMO17WK12:I2]PZW40901.1 tRNA A-37 threonylcarbamoyl transferase component Bud32 [Pseudomonas sp. URMO17WK12:I2]